MSTIYGDSIFKENTIEELLNESFADINYSPDQIKKICEYFQNFTINESSDLYVINEANTTTALQKLGVTNTSEVQNSINKASKEITDKIKKEGINRSTSKSIASIIENTISNIAVTITDGGKNSKMANATISLIIVVLVNTIIANVLVALFGMTIGVKILAIFVAPIVEELAKKVAIKGGYIVEFTTLFNSYEFINYVARGSFTYGFANMIKVRLMTVGMHITTTIVEFLTQNEKIQKLLKLDKQEDKDRLSFIGHITGMLIHGAWNAKLGNSIVKATLGLDIQ